MLDFNTLLNNAMHNAIELAVRDQLTPYIKRIEELENVALESAVVLLRGKLDSEKPGSTQIDPDTLAEAVSNALDDKMDSICERVVEDIDLHGAMRDFIKNEVTISLDTY